VDDALNQTIQVKVGDLMALSQPFSRAFTDKVKVRRLSPEQSAEVRLALPDQYQDDANEGYRSLNVIHDVGPVEDLIEIEVILPGGNTTKAFVDCGSQMSLISENLFDRIRRHVSYLPNLKIRMHGSVPGQHQEVTGGVDGMVCRMGNNYDTVATYFIQKDAPYSMLLGRNWM
jgi:hypothetical protein